MSDADALETSALQKPIFGRGDGDLRGCIEAQGVNIRRTVEALFNEGVHTQGAMPRLFLAALDLYLEKAPL